MLLHSNQNTELPKISFLLRNANLSSDNFCKVDADASKYATVTSHSSHFKPIFSSYSHHTHPPKKALYLPYSLYNPHMFSSLTRTFVVTVPNTAPPPCSWGSWVEWGREGEQMGGAAGLPSLARSSLPAPTPPSKRLYPSASICIFFSGDV